MSKEVIVSGISRDLRSDWLETNRTLVGNGNWSGFHAARQTGRWQGLEVEDSFQSEKKETRKIKACFA